MPRQPASKKARPSPPNDGTGSNQQASLQQAYRDVQDANAELEACVEQVIRKVDEEQTNQAKASAVSEKGTKCLAAEEELRGYLNTAVAEITKLFADVDAYRRDAAEPILKSYRESLKKLIT